MDRLNYHHLLYFWLVAREGGLAKACGRLRLSPSTLSGQIHALESALGQKLFEKKGRRLALTDMGRIVYGYADEIFTLGSELQDALQDRAVGKPLRLQVGVVDVVPKLVARQILAPALALGVPVRLVCVEDTQARLMEGLAMHELDVVLADAPAASTGTVKAFNHLIIECPVAILGSASLYKRFRKGFPQSLLTAPLLLPTLQAALRRSMDHWLSRGATAPRVMGEFDDRALMELFGESGLGVFPVAEPIAAAAMRQLQVRRLGVLDEIRERFYAITVERRVSHPGVAAICAAETRFDRRGRKVDHAAPL